MAEFMPQIVDRFEYSSWKPGKDRDKFKQEIYPNRETQEEIWKRKKETRNTSKVYMEARQSDQSSVMGFHS